MSPSVPCAHCGLPAPERADGPSFCCAGCRAVYGLLQDAGLGEFYALRSSLDAEPSRRPAEEGDELSARYAHLDDPEVVRAHGVEPGRATLELTGLHCAACVWVLERLPRVLPGVVSARVDYGRGRIDLRWDPERLTLSAVAAALDRLGYPPRLRSDDAEVERARRARGDLWRLAVTGALAGNVMLLAFALYGGAGTSDAVLGGFLELLSLLLALPAVTWGALPFYRGAWSGLRARVLHMDLPISLGILAGFCASAVATLSGTGEPYYDSVTALVFLLLVGRYVQQRGQQRVATRSELWQGLVPGMVERSEAGVWRRVYVSAVQPGDRLRVPSGDRVAVDGRVVQGTGHVDLSMLTGESRPEPIAPGSSVLAGSVNTGPAVEITVEAVGRETRLGRVLERLGAADAERAPVARLADRLAGWFVATVIGLAVVGGAVWWLHAGPTRAFEVVVSLLVVSCPCALGLATPLALAVARGRAARAGFVVRSTAALEALAGARRIVLDKTGTVTEGQVRVVDAGGSSGDEAVALAAVLERGARHPLAAALRRWARESGLDQSLEQSQGQGQGTDADQPATDVVEHPGRGIEGTVRGRRVRVGSPRWISCTGVHHERLEALLRRGATPVVIEVDGEVAVVVGLGDRLRPEAVEIVQELRRQGYLVSLRSGDHPHIVEDVAETLGIEDARGDRSPEDKAAEVRGDRHAIMVGDGINDALALRSAAVGVAVGGGAEAALAVADVYLQERGLRPLAALVQGARRTRAVIRRNLAFSLVYNVLFASLALAGLITPLLAAVLMPLSSLSVVLGSLLQRSFDASKGSASARSAQFLRGRGAFAARGMQ